MTNQEAMDLCDKIGKLWPTTIGHDQLMVLHPRLLKLDISPEQAGLAIEEEFVSPTTAKIGKIAAIYERLQRCNAPTERAGSGEWRPPNTFGEVLQAQQQTTEHTSALVQRYILGLQERCRQRKGQAYATDHAWKQWTIWRQDLIDAGMGFADATRWLIDNTEVERAWAEGLYRNQASGRERQVERMKRLAEQWAAEEAAA